MNGDVSLGGGMRSARPDSRVARGCVRCRVYSIKVPVVLIEHVDRTLLRFVHTRRQAPISRNEFIRQAIEEKLDHLRRSSRPHRHRGRRQTGTLRRGGNTARPANGLLVAAVGDAKRLGNAMAANVTVVLRGKNLDQGVWRQT